MSKSKTAVQQRPFAETALAHAAKDIPTAHPQQTVAEARQILTQRPWEAVDVVCILDDAGRLQGVVGLRRLFAANESDRLQDVMEANPIYAPKETDREEVASLAIRSEHTCVPIVDGDGVLVGLVPDREIVAILRQEHIEDVHRLAGIAREAEHVRETLESPPPRRARDRLPWLILGLVGSFFAAIVMSGFETTLEKNVAIAFFVPMIVYLADAIGTQTEAIVVRGLSLSRISMKQLFFGELAAGALMGLSLGGLALPMVWIGFHDPMLAIAVSTAIFFAGTFATGIGLLFPWVLAARGFDPAFGSGPVATVMQDVLSILVYFGAVNALT